MLRERQLAERFETILKPYVVDIISISAANQAGWPDRMVVLENSRVVFAELKLVKVRQDGKYPMHVFRPTQAAFMAKWQRNRGLCFLFLGLLNYDADFYGYHVLTMDHWGDWISLPKKSLALGPMTEQGVTGRFREFTQK